MTPWLLNYLMFKKLLQRVTNLCRQFHVGEATINKSHILCSLPNETINNLEVCNQRVRAGFSNVVFQVPWASVTCARH